jgi:hypothetical protein
MKTTTMAAAAAAAADNAVGIIKICVLKPVTFFALLRSANYSCGGGRMPKSSEHAINHGVGMTPMHWVGVSSSHRQW